VDARIAELREAIEVCKRGDMGRGDMVRMITDDLPWLLSMVETPTAQQPEPVVEEVVADGL